MIDRPAIDSGASRRLRHVATATGGPATERRQLEQAIVAQEARRGVVGGDIVDAAIAARRERPASFDDVDDERERRPM